ncbi:MAG: hypothetical protein JOZ44_19855 [Acidobacteria bacterium]|nr:hypothetical protein [Acidobacteriota bacterium]
MVRGVFRKVSLVGLSALLLFGTLTANAEDKCGRRIRNAEQQLRQAIRRHGPNSRQAEQKRRNLERVRDTCHR